MLNITEYYKGLQKCYEELFEIRLKKKTASSEEKKKDLLKVFKEVRGAKKKIREFRIAIAETLKKRSEK